MGNFISHDLVNSLSIPVNPIPPQPITTVDGSQISSGPITHKTCLLDVTIRSDSDITTTMDFHVTGIKHSVILGLPWLQQHNPSVDWAKGTIQKPLQPLNISQSSGHTQEVSLCSTSLDSDSDTLELGLESTVKSSPVSLFLGLVETSATTSTVTLPEKYQQYSGLFSKKKASKLPDHKPYDHAIPLAPGTMPPFGPIYSLSEPELKVLREYLDENLEKGFITPSTSPAGAPIMFQKKKDKTLRLCVDYRGLNTITVKNRYPLPLIHELLDRVRTAKVFTKLDLRGAYNLIRIKPEDEWKTAFRCRYGHFQYRVMPFGLANAPASFQAVINDVLRPYLDIFCLAYLDDILIYSDSQEEHDQHVMKVLEALQKADLFVKLEKCCFDVTETEFLGYTLSTNGIAMSEERLNTIQSWPTPKTLKELQSFLGFCNWYRKFISHYSFLTTPFKSLLKKDSPWNWTEEHQEAFAKLKEEFKPGKVLFHFDPALQTFLETDASHTAIGAILSQKDHNSVTRPVAFFSRSMNSAEQNYDIGEKELLAIVAALKHWRPYLLGTTETITILTDHANLVPFTTSKPLTGRIGRWALCLADYNFKIQHVSGDKNPRADALSRRCDYVKTPPEPEPLIKPHQLVLATASLDTQPITFDSEITLSGDMLSDLKKAYTKDPFTKKTLNTLHDNPEKAPDNLRHFSISPDGLLLFNNLIYIPRDKNIQQTLLQQHHDHPLAGHYGGDKTFSLMSRRYYMPNLRQIIHTYIQGCLQCSQNKPSLHKPYGHLESLPIPSQPWESISMDFIVKLPLSSSSVYPKQDLDSILVVVDRFSKMSHFIPCREAMSAEQLATLLFTHVFKLHGLPQSIITDRGSTFLSNFFTSLSKLLDIKQKISTAYHPQTDGQTERVNAILETYLRSYVNFQQDNWVDLLPLAEFAYNNSESATTKETPFYINYGQHPRFDPLAGTVSTTWEHAAQSAQDHVQKLADLRSFLQNHLMRAQDNQAQAFNRGRSGLQPFGVGDMVMLKRINFKTPRPSPKLDHKKLGPFKIIRQIKNNSFELELPATWKIHPVFHSELLEKAPSPLFQQEPPPPPAIIVQDQPEYEVEAILKSRKYKGKSQYLVKWKGYHDEENTWEPEANLKNSKLLLQDFKEKQKKDLVSS